MINIVNCSFANPNFTFQPTHPLYIQKQKPVLYKEQENTKYPKMKTILLKENRQHKKEINQEKKKTKNRLYSLPVELIQKIFDYDDTNRRYFDKNILCKMENTSKDKNDYYFYKYILNNRGFQYEHRKKYCDLITCGLRSSWYNDVGGIEYPLPHELVNITSRFISRVQVKKNIYEYMNEKYYFITCEMEIREFIKGYYRYLENPCDEEEIELYLFKNWEDEYEEFLFTPIKEGLYPFLNEKVEYGQYKKIILLGDAISDLYSLTLFADKNKQGKDIVHIQVDIDKFAIEDMFHHNTFSQERFNKKVMEIFNEQVYDVIQINKEYLSNHLFDR